LLVAVVVEPVEIAKLVTVETPSLVEIILLWLRLKVEEEQIIIQVVLVDM
tara:strand:- start:251 stop:400 length:150 start_codon:yes stop_codon:yes gene_type:complete